MAKTRINAAAKDTVEELHASWRQAIDRGASRQAAAHDVGYKSWSSLRDRFKAHGLDVAPASRVTRRAHVPSPVAPIAEILAKRKREFELKDAHERARQLIDVDIQDETGIVGVIFNGDEHLDNPGTDISAVERNVHLVKTTTGLYAVSMGDVTDAWIGRLQALYAQSGTTNAEANALGEWYIGELGEKLLWAVGGNHNAGWWGENDPFIGMMQANGTLYLDNHVRIALNINGLAPIKVNSKHGWNGRSMWNATHAIQRAAQMGITDDLLVGGHTHISGYALVKQPLTGSITHCVQVAAYKKHDQYARDRDMRDQHISPAVLAIFRPDASPVGRVQVFHDIEQGVDVLSALRERAVE